MKKIKGVFDSREEMLREKDSLIAKYLDNGGKIHYVKTQQHVPVIEEVSNVSGKDDKE